MADGTLPEPRVADLATIAAALEITKSVVEKRAAKECWSYESRATRGGQKRFYMESRLPADVLDALRRDRAIAAANAVRSSPSFQAGAAVARRLNIAGAIDAAVIKRQVEQGAAAAAGLTGTSKSRMEAKLDLLDRLDAFARERGLAHTRAVIDFSSAYNAGTLDVPAELRERIGSSLHERTLRQWKRDLQTQGAACLAGRYGHRAGSGVLDSAPLLRDFAVGLIVATPHIDATALRLALEARFTDIQLPALRSVQRWLRGWKAKNADTLLAVANPDAWKNQYKAAFGSASERIVRINQVWELDSTPGDIDLVDGRHTIIGAIDVATRRLRLHVSKTSSAAGVCSLLRRALTDWGVPEEVKIDNGRDYTAERVRRALRGLQVERVLSQPFSPWEKPHIERAFRTFSHGLLELLPSYLGHNVAEAQALRAKDAFADRLFKKGGVTAIKLTAQELQSFCDRWCDDLYAHAAHEGLDKDTPFQRAAAMRDVERRIDDVRALDLLMAEAPDGQGVRTVGKKGIKLDNAWFIAPELAGLIRQPVQVLYDERDIGQIVVYHDDAFVCIATCPERAGLDVSRKDIAHAASALQKQQTAQKRRELKALSRKANTAAVVEEVLALKRAQAEQLVAFPAPNVVHLTPALAAATEAADALERSGVDAVPAYDPNDPVYDVAALLKRERTEDETGTGRFVRALKAMQSPGNDIGQQWLKGYRDSSEFRGLWQVFESFGAATFGLDNEFNALLPADAPFHTASTSGGF